MNLPSLPPVSATVPLLRLKHTHFLSSTSVTHQSFTPAVCVHLCLPSLSRLCHCSTSTQLLLSSGGTALLRQSDWHCLPSWIENAALEEPLHVLLSFHPFLTAPDLAFVYRGRKRFPTWPLCSSTLIVSHSGYKCLLNANAKCKAGRCQLRGLISTCS